MGDKISVLVVDDHPLFREGVTQTLRGEPDIDVVGEAATADQAARLAAELLPDILLLDIDIPGGGLRAALTVAALSPVTKIVMLTVSEQEEHLVAALRAGARADILKGVAARELVRILRGVWAGEVYVTPSLAASLLLEMTNNGGDRRPSDDPLGKLTDREREILEQVAAGSSNKEIGLKLHLSEKTVKHHMTNILQKLQVRNRVEAALLAQKGGRAPHRV
jgi:two-component system nitrate/nitrite response regulator NarL